MSEKEDKVMRIYRESAPDEGRLFWRTHINHVAWSLLLVLVVFLAYVLMALAQTENQRNALMTRQCLDPVFKTDIVPACLKTVKTREHWWQHVGHALANATS